MVSFFVITFYLDLAVLIFSRKSTSIATIFIFESASLTSLSLHYIGLSALVNPRAIFYLVSYRNLEISLTTIGIDSNRMPLHLGHVVMYLFSELEMCDAHQKHDSHTKNSNFCLEPK